jgi:hypothetical protein
VRGAGYGVAAQATGLEGQGEGVLTAVSPGRENYGRLQGDWGKARDNSDRHFRKAATEYDRKPGINWLICTAQ